MVPRSLPWLIALTRVNACCDCCCDIEKSQLANWTYTWYSTLASYRMSYSTKQTCTSLLECHWINNCFGSSMLLNGYCFDKQTSLESSVVQTVVFAWWVVRRTNKHYCSTKQTHKWICFIQLLSPWWATFANFLLRFVQTKCSKLPWKAVSSVLQLFLYFILLILNDKLGMNLPQKVFLYYSHCCISSDVRITVWLV